MRTGRVANRAGDLSLRDMIGAASAADLVVCNSSLLLHTSAAFSVPSVVLLGPAFESARAHQRQWGYGGLSTSLGREPGVSGSVATVEEALAAVRDSLGRNATSGPE